MRAKSIVVFLLLFSCHSSDKETLEFLNNGIRKNNQQIEQLNDRYYTYAEMYMKENPSKFYALKKEADSLKILQSQIEAIIDSIKNQIFIQSDANAENGTMPDVQLEFSLPKHKKLLETSLNKYHEFISGKINPKKNLLFFSQINLDKLSMPVLDLLSAQIRTSSYWFLYQRIDPIGKSSLHPNKYVAVIIPKSYYVYPGESYEAEIGLTAIDTAYKPLIIIEMDTLPVKNGIARYKNDETKTIGHIVKRGKFVLLTQSSGQLIEFPVEINYKIVKK